MEKEIKYSLAQEPGVILDNFMKETKKIVSILNAREPSQLMMSLELIHKACTTNDAQSVTKLLWSLLVYENCFIKAVCSLGKEELAAKSVGSNFLEITTNLLHKLVQKFPEDSKSILEILLPHLLMVSETHSENKHILSELQKLEEVLKVCKKHSENERMFRKLELGKHKEKASTTMTRKAKKDSKVVATPFDLRLLPDIPANEETLSDKPFFLLPAIINKPYRNVEQYVDVHTRLVREDMFRGFRMCLGDFYSHRKLENGILYHYAYIHKLEQTTYGILFYFTVPVSPEVEWKTSKRLMPGSLLCLSCDGFQNFYFGSIYSQKNDGQCGTTCYLALRFETGKEPRHTLASYDIIEAGGYYEAYRHVFKNLRSLTPSTFPFKNSLLNYTGCNKAPFSLTFYQKRMLRTFQSEINDYNQNKAFELAMKNKIALIQGPPGTGKSYLGAQVVRYLTEVAYVRKPIIVMSFTNHALDQFLEKLLDFTDKIVRIGGQSKSEKLEPYNLSNLRKLPRFRKQYNTTNKFYRKVKAESEDMSRYLDECLRSRIYPFTKDAVDLRLCDIYRFHDVLESGKLKGNILNTVKLSADKIKLYRWLKIDGLCSEIYDSMEDFKKELTIELLDSFQISTFQENTIPRLNILKRRKSAVKLDHLSKLLITLCVKKSPGSFFRWYGISSTEVECFVQKYLPSNETVFPLFLRAAVRCAEENRTTINMECNDLLLLNLSERWKLLSVLLFEASALNICQELDGYICPDRKEGGKLPLNQKGQLFNMQRYKESCKDLKSNYVVQDARLLKKADIIGLTVTGGAKNLDLLKELNATTYIIEEAAQVFESHVLASLVPRIEHLILIGDHSQLKPSPVVYDLAVKYHLDISLFERLFKNDAPSLCLQVQHRMRPSISGLLVPEFYRYLENHPSVLEYENVGGIASNVFFLQHSNLENESGEFKSHANTYEALLIVTLCQYLISQGNNPSSITILTTYNRQLDLITANLQENRVEDVLATTVDNYQGEENDIVLISFVRSNVGNKVGFIKTPNRLCVALSRARRGLYCVGNFNMFASESAIWKSLLTKLQDMSSFGEKLEINCCKHPETKSLISTTSDIENHMRKGCNEPCNKLMNCGHVCGLLCHMSKCNDGECTMKTDITLRCGHTFTFPCFYKNSLDIIRCKKCVDRTFHDFVTSYSYRKGLTQNL